MKKAQENPEKRITPPYVSVATLERVLELASNRNYPSFSSDIFKKQGFNDSDASWSVNALRFLGLVADDGSPMPLMSKLRLSGEVRKVEIEKIVRNAYKPLFDATTKPEDLPYEKLMNEFVVQYDMSRRLAESASRVFMKLCEHAGLKEKGSVVAKIHAPRGERQLKRTEPMKRKERSGGLEVPTGFYSIAVAEGRILLGIPQNLKNRILTGDATYEDWRNVLNELQKFADKYLPKGEPRHDPKAESG